MGDEVNIFNKNASFYLHQKWTILPLSDFAFTSLIALNIFMPYLNVHTVNVACFFRRMDAS